MRRATVLGVLLALLGIVGLAPAHAATPPFADGDGLHVVSATQADPRLWKLVVSTSALSRPVRVNVLLPTGYAGSTQRYPVLYLFHGTSGGADDWLDQGQVEQTTAHTPLIVVMPDAGYDSDGGSWFTDWVDQTTSLGAADWETFHLDQLVPFVDQRFRTIPDRAHRAIAGLSQGGYGAFAYAAEQPDLFSSAASFSGAPDITSDPTIEAGATAVIAATATGLDQVEPDAFFGPHLTDEINWQGHDPAQLVDNLRATYLQLWTADGAPGAYDKLTDPGYAAAAGIEALTHYSTDEFVAVAQKAGLHPSVYDYGAGTHSWPYWTRDLQQYVPALMSEIAHGALTPAPVSYSSIQRTWTQWGWTVANQRTAPLAWSRLTGASARGFALSGTGSATVTTPPAYAPGSFHPVTVGGVPWFAKADASGRLAMTVTLPATVTIS